MISRPASWQRATISLNSRLSHSRLHRGDRAAPPGVGLPPAAIKGPRSLIGAAAGKFGRQRLRRRGEFLQLLEDGEQLAFDGDADAAGLAHGAPNLTLSLEQTPQFGLGFHGCSCLSLPVEGKNRALGPFAAAA